MKKVKNVIKGYESQMEIKEVTFFEDDRVLFSGQLKGFRVLPVDSFYPERKRCR